jgi:hypothetical protein
VSQPSLLKRVPSVLDGAGIDYMVTGALASGLYGEPRATHDIDLVVELVPEKLPELLAAFSPPEFYLSETAARQAVRFGGTFNLIETAESENVDFWLLTDDPFDRARFSRKRYEELFGMQLKFSSPEDTILQQAHTADRITFTALTPWPGDLVCAEGRYVERVGSAPAPSLTLRALRFIFGSRPASASWS